MPEIQGFPPIADARSCMLILGSMPSAASLAKQQYYAHPRNAFWPIMGALFGACPELGYEQRKAILLRNGVAVWDVLASCRRKGSADSDIAVESMQTNDFGAFFRCHAAIKRVFFNGGTAEAVYNRRILPTLGEQCRYLSYRHLPSSSPAYAGMAQQQKIASWRSLLLDENDFHAVSMDFEAKHKLQGA